MPWAIATRATLIEEFKRIVGVTPLGVRAANGAGRVRRRASADRRRARRRILLGARRLASGAAVLRRAQRRQDHARTAAAGMAGAFRRPFFTSSIGCPMPGFLAFAIARRYRRALPDALKVA